MNNWANTVKAETLIPWKIRATKGSDLRNAYLLNLVDSKNLQEYNVGMSARGPSGAKMYAKLEQRECSKCQKTKSIKEFGKDSTQAGAGHSYKCKFCKRKWLLDYRSKNLDLYKRNNFKNDLKKNYGMTIEQYEAFYSLQKGCCASCGDHESTGKRKLNVDHDHETGLIRGLLCNRCNPGIGYFNDSVERLAMAIRYLNKFKK